MGFHTFYFFDFTLSQSKCFLIISTQIDYRMLINLLYWAKALSYLEKLPNWIYPLLDILLCLGFEISSI